MSILITGARGFVGQQLASVLLKTEPSTRLVLVDLKLPPVPAGCDASRVSSIAADLTSQSTVDQLFKHERGYAAVYLLHGIMSSGSEADFDLGMRVNLMATQYIFSRLAKTIPGVKVIYTSSLAVYGPTEKGFVINERNYPQIPTSSYGTQKMACELLLNDYSRKGYIDGRAVRLPTVTVRAGAPTQAASSFASGILREPLNGESSVLPVKKNTVLWICSPMTVARNLIIARDIPGENFKDSRSVNLPGITVSVQEMLDVLETVGGKEARALVTEEYDQEIDTIVAGWSPNFDVSWARSLGFVDDMPLLESVKLYAQSLPARQSPSGPKGKL